MRQIINNIKLLGLVLVLIPTIPVYAANDSQTFELEEIVVTARKREESLQDVPISIVTLSGDELRKNGVQRMDYLAATVPNLHYSHTPSAVDLSMLFLKYLSDVWQDRYGDYEAEYDGNQELIEDETRNVRFFLPFRSNFYNLYLHRQEPGNGDRIDRALKVIALEGYVNSDH